MDKTALIEVTKRGFKRIANERQNSQYVRVYHHHAELHHNFFYNFLQIALDILRT